MTPSLLLDNVFAWSAQVALLVAVAAAADLLLRHSHARLLFWQSILAISLLLPILQPWAPAIVLSTNGVSISMQSFAAASGPTQNGFIWKREYLLVLFAIGTAARLAWIAAGFTRLRAHRLSASTLANPPVPFERPHVRWYLSDTVSGPVTFGWLRPSILLPSRVNRLSEDLREAIACHELVHVERADWLFVLGEEIVRAALWFHPAIWFVLSRIQLSREQTVDLEVIRLTRNRDRYLDALVAVAQHKLQPDFTSDIAPAPLFLKKRQLAVRVAHLLNEAVKETRMSKPRLAFRFATVFSTALAAARLAVWFFPLQAPAQSIADGAQPPDGAGITVDAGAPLMHRTPVTRGLATAAGTVVIEASLNEKGEVVDARAISGPEELRKPALQSVLQWHYSTISSLPPTVRVTIKFDPVSNTSGVRLATARTATSPSTLKAIEFSGTSPELEQQVRAHLTAREGEPFSADTAQKIVAAAREIDEHFTASVFTRNANDGTRETTVRLTLNAAATVPPAAMRADGNTPPQKIRVGGNVQQANLIVKVTPAYPPDAKQARIQGVVKLLATINKDGTIQTLDVISGEPVLASAAIDAVKQWVYKPTLLNGNAVEVITQIDVNFTLTQ